MTDTTTIRPARVAGAFYSSNPAELRQEIEERLARATETPPAGEVLAAAVPHAGYIYSADIAAHVFKALRNVDFDTVVIIGHDFGSQAPGIIGVVPNYTAFRTPLGDVPVDAALCRALQQAEPRILCNDRVHAVEHTVEVQLPFLQVTHPDVRIVPLLFGEVTPEHCQRLAALLSSLRGDRKLLVLSSTDLSHYPPAETSRALDRMTVGFAERMDLEGLCRWKNGGDWEGLPGVETPICSAGGLGTALAWAKQNGATRTVVLKRGNSGDVSGDNRRVVGYSSLLFVKANAATAPKTDAFSVSESSQKLLLELARSVIASGAQGKELTADIPDTEELKRLSAVFVTLHKHGQLRGCIGTTMAHLPLYRAVAEYAQAAAFQDPRFRQVTAEELPELQIEISVLSPMRRVASPAEIRPGHHGVLLQMNGHSGLFLPQVWEQLPDKEQFLGYLCAEKAGLPYDAWKNPAAELLVFTVFAFEERQ